MFRRSFSRYLRQAVEIVRDPAKHRVYKAGGALAVLKGAKLHCLIDGSPTGHTVKKQQLTYTQAKNIPDQRLDTGSAGAVSGYVIIAQALVLKHAQNEARGKGRVSALKLLGLY